MSNSITGIILVFGGLLAVIGAALNWSIIMHPSKLFNRIVGESVARPFYIAVGFVLIVIGMLRFANINFLR